MLAAVLVLDLGNRRLARTVLLDSM
jgi:hypothetical protein